MQVNSTTARIPGLKMCQAYRREYQFDAICAMPTNLYGPGDNFNLGGSHVLPALIRKCHEATLSRAASVEIWRDRPACLAQPTVQRAARVARIGR